MCAGHAVGDGRYRAVGDAGTEPSAMPAQSRRRCRYRAVGDADIEARVTCPSCCSSVASCVLAATAAGPSTPAPQHNCTYTPIYTALRMAHSMHTPNTVRLFITHCMYRACAERAPVRADRLVEPQLGRAPERGRHSIFRAERAGGGPTWLRWAVAHGGHSDEATSARDSRSATSAHSEIL